jgi:hypothetical protein
MNREILCWKWYLVTIIPCASANDRAPVGDVRTVLTGSGLHDRGWE